MARSLFMGCSFLLAVILSACSSQQATTFDCADIGEFKRTEESVYRLQGLCVDGFLVSEIMLGRLCGYRPSTEVRQEIEALSKMPLLAKVAVELIERDRKSFSVNEFTNQGVFALIHALMLWERRFIASTATIRKKIYRLAVEESENSVMYTGLDRYEAEMDEFEQRNGR